VDRHPLWPPHTVVVQLTIVATVALIRIAVLDVAVVGPTAVVASPTLTSGTLAGACHTPVPGVPKDRAHNQQVLAMF
jgi:hypothetical protein